MFSNCSEDPGSEEGEAGVRVWICNLARQGSVPAIFSPNLLLQETKGLHLHCCDLHGPEKISFTNGEVFLLFTREKNNLDLLRDRMCMRVCAFPCINAHTSIPVSASAGPSLTSQWYQSADSPQSSKGKNGGVWREKVRRAVWHR